MLSPSHVYLQGILLSSLKAGLVSLMALSLFHRAPKRDGKPVALARRLSRPFDYIEFNRIREAFQPNLTVAPKTEPLAGTQLWDDTCGKDLTWFCGAADSGREINR